VERIMPIKAMLDALTRLEIELAWLAGEIDAEIVAELVRVAPAGSLLVRRRPECRHYALAARRPRGARRVPDGRPRVG
jgi:hypothetical protein